MENNQQPLHLKQQTDQSHSVSSATPYSPSKTFIILMVVLITVTVGIGGYILGAKQNRIVKNQTPPVTSITQPSPTIADETANWKTYSNPLYTFTFAYPDNLFTRNEYSQPSNYHTADPLLESHLFMASVEYCPTKQSKDCAYNKAGGSFSVDIHKNPTNLTLEQWSMKSPFSPLQTSCYLKDQRTSINKTTLFLGHTAIRYDFYIDEVTLKGVCKGKDIEYRGHYSGYILSVNKYVYSVSIVSREELAKQYLNQILSTFRFD